MSLHRFKAVLIGLIEAKRANEWVVTQKQGDAPRMNARRCANPDLESPLLLDDASTRNTWKNIAKRYYLSLSARNYVSTNLSLSLSLSLSPSAQCMHMQIIESIFGDNRSRFYHGEIGMGVILLACGIYDVLVAKKWYFFYIFLQGIAFLAVGFDYVGVPPDRLD